MGPVPLRLLDEMALPRPKAFGGAMDALQTRGHVTLGGASGSGRSTLAHQIAHGWPYASVFVDAHALLRHDEAAWASEILQTLGHRARQEATSWSDLARRVRRTRPPLWVLDDPPADLAAAMQEEVPGAYLIIQPDGDIAPDAISASAAKRFLRERTLALDVGWRNDAVAEAVRLADGQPGPLQRIGQECLHGALRARRDLITLEDALESSVVVAHQLPDRLMRRLGRLSPARLQLLKAIARFPDATPTQWAALAGVPQRSTAVHLARLVDTDRMLEKTGWGAYRIASSLLAMHLKSVYGTPVSSHRPR